MLRAMPVILKGEPVARQDANALDRVPAARRKDFPRAPGSRVTLTYVITDLGRGVVMCAENVHPFPLEAERYHAPSARTVPFREHLREKWLARRPVMTAPQAAASARHT
jgi:hypothetical protein